MLKKAALFSLCCLLLYGLGLIVVYDLFDDNLPDIDELETCIDDQDYESIQAAVEAAGEGQVVQLCPGVYEVYLV